jgi:hypothetical protein
VLQPEAVLMFLVDAFKADPAGFCAIVAGTLFTIGLALSIKLK